MKEHDTNSSHNDLSKIEDSALVIQNIEQEIYQTKDGPNESETNNFNSRKLVRKLSTQRPLDLNQFRDLKSNDSKESCISLEDSPKTLAHKFSKLDKEKSPQGNKPTVIRINSSTNSSSDDHSKNFTNSKGNPVSKQAI